MQFVSENAGLVDGVKYDTLCVKSYGSYAVERHTHYAFKKSVEPITKPYEAPIKKDQQ